MNYSGKYLKYIYVGVVFLVSAIIQYHSIACSFLKREREREREKERERGGGGGREGEREWGER